MTSNNSPTLLNDTDSLLLDTHILIWYAEGVKLSPTQVEIIESYRKISRLFISAISIWEIAMLLNKSRLNLSLPLQEWLDKLLALQGLSVADLSLNILIESCNLPNFQHKDPADKMLIATARCMDLLFMTMDQKLIDYAKNGNIKLTV